jgi:hypothetical protein
MRPVDVNEYLFATEHVHGWLFPVDAHLFAIFDEAQKKQGISGNLFEIGVHHGKTAALLGRLAARGETIGVCDVFEQQHLNVSQSGDGNRLIFEQNMRRFAPNAQFSIFPHQSSTLTPSETTTTCRIFHIDGGHRPEDVFSDLEVASRALLPTGIVIVDDAFNSNWPGVSEGLYRFFAHYPNEFAPIFIGGNKAYFARPNMVAKFSVPSLPDGIPYVIGEPVWFGRTVQTAINRAWVDLDPLRAARLHYRPRTWKGRIRRYLIS